MQIGLIQKSPNDFRLFWEWDSSPTDHHFKTGAKVALGTAVRFEIDHDEMGSFTLYANEVEQASVRVTWVPTAIGVFAETHSSDDYLPGSQESPAIISGLDQRVAGRWARYQGSVLITNDHYRISNRADGSELVWDSRQ